MDIKAGNSAQLCEENCKRNIVINSAANLFLEHSYEGTSIGDISMSSNVDRASIYYYFKDKADIANSVFNSVSAFYNTYLLEPYEAQLNNFPRQLLANKFIDDLLDLINQDHAWLTLMYDTGVMKIPEVSKEFDSHSDDWQKMILNFLTPLERANINPQLATQTSFELIVAKMRIALRKKHSNCADMNLKKLLKSLWVN